MRLTGPGNAPLSTAPAPLDARRPEPTLADALWLYDLEPSYTLPTLDLARTVQSEFYSARMNKGYRIVRRHGGLLIVAYLATTLSYLGTLMTSAAVGGYIAVFGVVVGLPGNFLTLGQLRFDILKLLMGCFDMWLQSFILWFVFAVLALMLGDLRGIIAVSFWLGSWPNTCNDAVLVAIRPVVVFSVICIFTCGFIVVGVNSNTIDGLRDFHVLQYGANALPARAAVTDGFGTIAALMMRNVYRRRALFQGASRSNELECVIYRCRLRLVRHDQTRQHLDLQCTKPAADKADDESRAHIQPMRFIPLKNKIDARKTLAPSASLFITTHPQYGRMWPVLACLAVLLAVTSTVMMTSSEGNSNRLHLAVMSSACALTVINSITSVCLFQRQLLRVVCTSFDFIFLAIHLTLLHVCACDLFEWRMSAVMLGSLSWQWAIWVLLLDTFTLPVRTWLHMCRGFPRFIYACCLVSICLLGYMMSFATTPARIVDRVIWSGVVMGQPMAFRVLPQFYSALVMVFLYMLRYCWRQFQFAESDLIVIDSSVVFKNSFTRPRRNKARVAPSPTRSHGPNMH